MAFSSSNGSLSGSSDVSLNNPANNQVLAYNSTLRKWQNTTISGGGGITGVNISKIVVSDTYPSGLNTGDFWFRPYAAGGPAIPYQAGTYFTDDFARADGDLGIAAHGEQYAINVNSGTGMQIASQAVYASSGNGNGAFATIGITNLPQTRAIALTINNYTSMSVVGLLLGFGSTSNYVQVQLTASSAIRLVTVVGGSTTNSSSTSVTLNTSSTFKATLTVNGDSTGTVKIYVDGVLKYTPPNISAANMSALIGNSVGFFVQRNNSSDASTVDNISITDS
jgi:hypothetical protein